MKIRANLPALSVFALVLLSRPAWLPGQEAPVAPEATAAVKMPFTLAAARVLFPGAAVIGAPAAGRYPVTGENGELLGRLVYGPPAGVEIEGHHGPVPFLVGLNPDGRVTGVHLLPAKETPGYARRAAEGLREAWKNLTVREASRAKVDTVTGATDTSMALVEGVRVTLERLDAADRAAAGITEAAESVPAMASPPAAAPPAPKPAEERQPAPAVPEARAPAAPETGTPAGVPNAAGFAEADDFTGTVVSGQEPETVSPSRPGWGRGALALAFFGLFFWGFYPARARARR
jgi:hypothetical protein